MRTIDLSDYTTSEGQIFNVRPSLVVVLFSEPKLGPREMIRRDELARRIEEQVESVLLVEEEDYARIVRGLEHTDFKEIGRAAVPLIERVLNAPVAQVELKK